LKKVRDINKMKVLRVLCVLLSAGLPVLGQTAKPTQTKTKIETFEAKTGAVIIRGFTTTGGVVGQLGGQVTVEAVEMSDAAAGSKMSGVKINVAKGDSIGTENASFVDADEIDSLLKGIDYITKLDASVTKMKSFQADYRTKGDLDIATYSNSNGGIGAAIISGEIGPVQVFLPHDGLVQLRALLVEAQGQIAAAR
jgi:hypothetical protein